MKLISCQQLGKRFGGVQALDNLSIEISAGEPVALIGPNGAGKTTFLSIVCGFLQPSCGQISVLGHAPGSKALSGKLAALPQDALFDPRRTIGAQLRLFARLQGMSRQSAADQASQVLQTVGLPESIDAKASQLSHGMRKRVAIAQALIGQPELVLLDEPTAGVDPPNAKLIRDLIKNQTANTTFIVSSHNLDELERLCESVIYLENGRLVSFGPVSAANEERVLTLRLPTVDEAEVVTHLQTLSGVSDVTRTLQGDYLIETSDDMLTSVELMQLLRQKQWPYRAIGRGRTLEQRLYG